MHRVAAFLALVLPPAPPVSAAAAEIPRGAHVLLRMVNSVGTKTAQTGDYVYLQTASPIVADGRVLIPPGSYVQGVVSHVRRSGRVKGRAELAIRLETLTLAGGRVLKFAPRVAAVDAGDTGQKVEPKENEIKPDAGHRRDAARIAILAGSGASIGGIADRNWRGAGIGAGAGAAVGLATVMLGRGSEVQLRAGSTLDVVIDRAVLID